MGILSAVYGVVLSGRDFFYLNIRKPKKLPAKVISIGNITLGGTGKTPAVIATAEKAKGFGFKPCILTRGYKSKAKGPVFAGKGNGPVLSAKDAGDEPCLMAERLEGVPVVIGGKRYLSGIFALENMLHDESTLFILDDGFQHISLHRDIDVLLIDSTNPFGNGRLFPEGRLREPLKGIERADIIVMTKADMAGSLAVENTIQKIKVYNPGAPIFTASHKPAALADISGKRSGLEELRDKEVYVFSGIANPMYFKEMLNSGGAEVVRYKKFRDHHYYRQREIDKIIRSAAGRDIITTEKDMVKLRGMKNTENIRALIIDFSIDEDFYGMLFKLSL
ncbi:MAG: tetraacyldisaccharide 4'-kinase [Nitrospirae bacterium]|nr:tetraacyldisaccharide 4'-kinase [Nitrospirota bacterium]